MPKALLGVLEVATEVAAVVFLTPIIGPAAAVAVGTALVAVENLAFAPKSPKLQTTEQAIKQPIPTRVSAYGECRRITIVIP